MAASTHTSLTDARIQQAYTDGGVDVLNALIKGCQAVVNQNPDMGSDALEMSEAFLYAMRATRDGWSATVAEMSVVMAEALR